MLNEPEKKILKRLLQKMEWPLDRDVFYALVKSVATVGIECAVLDSVDRLLMIYRRDREYVGWHIPGTILRNAESISDAIRRIMTKELNGTVISAPINIGWVETTRGTGPDQDPNRHVISLIFLTRLKQTYLGQGKFFDIDNPPRGIINTHYRLLRLIKDGLLKINKHPPIVSGVGKS